MTLLEIQEHIMHQTNNDADDLGDYLPHLNDYINEGYDRLVRAWDHTHTISGGNPYPMLAEDTDIPAPPEWTHRYLADWATWLIYRNGNPQKQNRGIAFRQSFEEMLAKVAQEGGASGVNADGSLKRYNKFRNIPY